jgi:hypothetical protein
VDEGEQGEVYGVEVLRAKGDEAGVQGAGVGNEPGDLDLLAVGGEGFKVGGATCEFDGGAAIVVAQEVVAANAHLEDAFVEGAIGAGFAVPEVFAGFLALNVFALVELVNGVEQFGRGWFLAGGGHDGPAFCDEKMGGKATGSAAGVFLLCGRVDKGARHSVY